MAAITNVINVTANLEGKAAGRDNMNIVAIFTPERGDVLSSASRFKIYTSASDVATDFGTESKTYAHALAAFSQTPNPVSASGYIAIIYHRASAETVPAEPGILRGEQFNESTVLSTLQRISDGSAGITIDSGESTQKEINLTGLDFRTCAGIADIVSVIAAAVGSDADLTYNNNRFTIKSKTTGSTSSVSFATTLSSGTYIGDILMLSDGSGAVSNTGTSSAVLDPETQLEAVSTGKALVNFKGFVTIDRDTDAIRKSLATWAQANNSLYYEVFSTAINLEIATSNVVWDITLSGLTNCRMLYDSYGDRKLATAYMARMHTVNFSAENTAITMHLKTLAGVTARDYDQNTITKAKKVGLDLYTTIKDVACLLTSGANDFTDNRYNLIAFVDSLQTDLFNLFKTTSTKIGQDQQGVDQELDTLEKTCRSFIKAGVFGAGEWTSSETFGDLEQFKRGIRENGYFTQAGELAVQSPDERQARISPPLHIACKNRGAFHSANIIVNLNF